VRTQTSTWPDKHGFVGGYQDTTGLTHLGARDYDPTTGRFTAVDPVLTPDLPQTLNAYAYANNAPATESDPSGLSACYSMGSDGLLCNAGTPQAEGCSWNKSCNVQGHHTDAEIDKRNGKHARDEAIRNSGISQAAYKDAQAVVKKSKWDVFVEAAGELIKGLIGWDDIKDCVTQGAFGACVRTVINFIPWGKVLKAGEIIADFWKGAKALITFGKEVEKAEKVIVDTEKVLADADRAANAAADAERAASEVAHGAEEAKGAESGASCALHSFVAGTLVLLADGTTKPIEQVHDGDVVRTTDPATGAVEDHKVAGTLVHSDENERTEVTLDSGGTVVATDWHPVWVEEAGDWLPIGSLVAGEHLHSADGRSVLVTAVRHFEQQAPVYDLTVDSIHDYFVGAAGSSVLVHNCGSGEAASGASNAAESSPEYARQLKRYGKDGVRDLGDGRFRFYGKLSPPVNAGEMAGRRTVREWNSLSGAKRTYHETLDHAGRIRIVRPEVKFTGGVKVHYVFSAIGEFLGKR
jgi:RHS repeat-associated protein